MSYSKTFRNIKQGRVTCRRFNSISEEMTWRTKKFEMQYFYFDRENKNITELTIARYRSKVLRFPSVLVFTQSFEIFDC